MFLALRERASFPNYPKIRCSKHGSRFPGAGGKPSAPSLEQPSSSPPCPGSRRISVSPGSFFRFSAGTGTAFRIRRKRASVFPELSKNTLFKAREPFKKKVALMFLAFRISRILAVFSSEGPSSKVKYMVLAATGVEAKLFRFPGGSINAHNKKVYQQIAREMTDRGYIYYDISSICKMPRQKMRWRRRCHKTFSKLDGVYFFG